ncbi:predicted pseudomurein-binding protein [Methanothermobacter marburgensis str. Marburg]|uniref:Predicted pseudomurein-binding protein n=1 Tax=Methanothermobacter marburgensis (strain ATCC BAA-927 / DSM 2133 / JCM 14651 / NBRC 100331 / OCM 82 / Marburg) TaxID=79929 RepID=D9PVF2_METTM|nr:pseudomurein-binding repeat-containing protein [Methanothermobacter marburgensis]ADL58200.1 predicted pseudomurein-binding protein [Methanothermobacter marburgensis str. Marburg]
MKRYLPLILLGLIAIAFSGTASAVDIYVNSTGGDDNNDGLSWAAAKATIKNATGSAADNDVIWLADGEYTGPNNRGVTLNKNLTITGQTKEGTVIKLEGNPSLFTITKNLKLSNLTIRNAYSTTSGPVHISNANLKIENCLLLNNTAVSGGAVHAEFSTVTIENSALNNNTATYGGAMSADSFSTVTIENSALNNNTATHGGAIYSYIYSTLTIRNSTLNNNTATHGGAICTHSTTTVTIENSALNNNTATKLEGCGGAIRTYYYSKLTIRNSTLNNNTAPIGGAIFATYFSTVPIENSALNNNTATFLGEGGGGGAIHTYYYSKLTIRNSTLNNNTATYGGAVLAFCSTVTIENSTLNNNTAPKWGGVIYASSSNLTIYNSTLNNNTATYIEEEGGGGAIYASSSNLTIYNSTLNNNTATLGGAIHAYDSTVTITNTTLTNNTASLAGAILVRDCPAPARIMFCRIFNNPDRTDLNVYADNTVDARFNWWGSNTPDFSILVSGSVTYNPWIVLSINANPGTVLIGGTSQITADLHHDSDGALHDPSEGLVPYTGPANFSTTPGSIEDTNFTDGTATSTLTDLNTKGVATVCAKVDNETLNTTVTVLKPATFALTNLTVTPTTGTTPLNIRIKAMITNTGDFAGDYTATLKVNQRSIQNQTTTLNPGETKTIEFTLTITQPGTYNVTIGTLPPKLVTAGITINQLAGTANSVIKYYARYKRLPSSVTISGKKFTMAQLLDLLVRATIQINAGNLKPLSTRTVGYTGSTGTTRSIRLSKSLYISTAITIRNSINRYTTAPKYATTSYGKIPFTRLVYLYSKVLGFYGSYRKLPSYVSI